MKNKVIASLVFAFFLFKFSVAQKTGNLEIFRTSNDLKTGNSNDVLVSFFQLAFSDITGNDKAFKFQSSLFNIRAKADTSLLRKVSYLKNNFSRNLNFSIAPILNENFKFKSNRIGLKLALVNNRDKSIYGYFDSLNIKHYLLRNKALTDYKNKFGKKADDLEFKKAVWFFAPDETDLDYVNVNEDSLPKEFVTILRTLIDNSIFKENKTLSSFKDTLAVKFEKETTNIPNKGLLVFETAGTSDAKGKLFSAANFNLEYLKGITKPNNKMSIELNCKANLDFVDDTASIANFDLDRKVFSIDAGFNWIMLKNKQNKSLMELKVAVAYNNILSGRYLGKANSSFTANGVFRIKITDKLWIPFDIKYDPKNGKVFGFLSVKSNFEGLGLKK